jgi:hypothetical protein
VSIRYHRFQHLNVFGSDDSLGHIWNKSKNSFLLDSEDAFGVAALANVPGEHLDPQVDVVELMSWIIVQEVAYLFGDEVKFVHLHVLADELLIGKFLD